MTEDLITALLNKKAFETNTIVTARYTSVDVFGRKFEQKGNFRVRRVLKANDCTMFELMTVNNGAPCVLAPAACIEAVDGMEVTRYADIYDLLPDGSNKKVGRKRGRKPKSSLSA